MDFVDGPRLKALPDESEARADLAVFTAAAAQLARYFAGELTSFDLPLRPAGTDFQQRVWMQLRAIPFGQTRTYGQLAAGLGQPTASRAVGLANGQNPLSIVVPCHRVIGANGQLTGFGGGLTIKQALLDLEAPRGLFHVGQPLALAAT